MDKNMINIDDLVRQRLLGGEERERAGAWLRMSELLEEEMPRVAPVGLPWRRIFGGLAVLALLGGLGVGGYELNAYAHRGSGAGNAITASVVSPATTATHNTSAGSVTALTHTTEDNTGAENHTPTPQTATGNTEGQPAGRHNTNAIAANITDIKHTEAGKQTFTKTAPVTAGKNDQPVGNNSVAATAGNNNHTTGDAGTAAVTSASDKAVAAGDNASTNTTAAAATGNSSETTQRAARSEHKTVAANTVTHKHAAARKSGEAAQPAKDGGNGNDGKTAGSGVAVKADNPAAKTTAKKNDATATGSNVAVKTTSIRTKTTGGKDGKTGDAVAVSKTGNAAKQRLAGSTTVSKLALSSSTHTSATAKTPKSASTGGSPATNPSAKRNGTLALNSKSPAAKKGVVTGKVADAKKPAARKTTVPAAAKDAVASTDKGGSSAAPAAGAPSTGAPAAKAGGSTGTSEISAINAKKGKRIIQQLVLRERITAAIPHATNIHLDTISYGDFTELYDLPGAAGGANPLSPKKGGSGDLAENIRPGSEAPAADPSKPAKKTTDDESNTGKTKDIAKKSKGAMAIQSLAAAFNDIKYKSSHAQFAAGLTGGVNGTFLGPNSFKGFQFGVTGKYIFSDALIIMGELKYCHRINDGYTLNDDYYNYSPTQGGYTKQLVSNPYGISTLHSVELPVTIRYCIGNFNFFVGGNFVYLFSINTGDYPTVATTAPTTVSAMGNDNAPKIRPNDFGSKFGLGSIFGLSYEVSPKVTLDLRDVQTFWDNSKTAGAKYISSQLYRSPSFQLSLGYRFGGKKKDK